MGALADLKGNIEHVKYLRIIIEGMGGMLSRKLVVVFGVSAALGVANSSLAVSQGLPAGGPSLITSAESAGPASIAKQATIVAPDAAGKMQTLRAGTNGWSCMPDAPTTPGPDPMCWDASAGKWLDAYMGHKTPPANTVGVIYMLAGGSDPGNTDPYADKPHQGEDWVTTGPHIMIVGSKEVLSGYPAGPKPNTAAPYVMWAGTPYAHLMIPVR